MCTVLAQFIAIGIGSVTMTLSASANGPNLADMLPAEIRGWTSGGPDGVYSADTLYDYIDGSAEVYRSFNVRTVVARRYVKDGAPDIIVDLFDMGSSRDAYGAYHHDIRDGPDVGIGRESEHVKGGLSFWKDRYFVSIMAIEETDESKRAMLETGTRIAGTITRDGKKPDILELVPETGLVRKHLHYFHDHICLNVYYYLADKNLLGLGRDTEGVIARYKPGTDASQYVVLLIRYPSAKKARAAYKQFLAGYLPDADAHGVARTENGKWTAVRLADNLIIGVFDAPSKPAVEQVIKDVLHHKDAKDTKKARSK